MLRSAAPAAAFASLYFLTAALTSSLIGDPGIAVLWPASGVYLGVMLVAPRRVWPSLACAAGVGSLAAYLHAGSSLEVSVAFAVPSSAEGLLAAVLVERIAGGRFTLGGLRDLVALVVGGALIANALVALSAGAVAAQTFGASFAESWLRWWSADALGMIAVAPLVVWARGRWGMRGAAIVGLAVALAATYVASLGTDLLGDAVSADAQVYIVQAFLAMVLLGSLALAAAVGEGRRARADVGRIRGRLGRVLDSSPDAYLAVDARDRITAWSASAEAMFGWAAPEALGRSLTETIGPGAGPATPTPESRELALVARDRGGRRFPVALTVRSGSEDGDGDCHIFIRNLADSERLQDELRRTKAELERRRLARDEVRHELERATAELERAGRRSEELTRELTARSAELATAGRAQERLAEELHLAKEARRRTEAELAHAREALTAANQELQRLGRELALATADRDTVLGELDDSTREQARLEAELGGTTDELARAQRERTRLESELESAAEELADAGAASRALAEELEHLRAEQARTGEKLESARAEHAQIAVELESVRMDRARTADELHRVEAEQARTIEELERVGAERERLQRSLDEAREGLAGARAERRLLDDHSTEMVSRYDERGICVYASPGARRLLGYEPHELVGRAGAELLHPEDRHRLARARASRSESEFEARLRRKAGDFTWVEVSLQPVWAVPNHGLHGVTTIVRDISGRRAADDRRRLAETRFNSLFGTVPSASALLGRDGRFEKTNAALWRLTGYSRERLEGAALEDILRREEADSCRAGLRRVASGEIASLRLDRQLVHASGRTIPVELSVTPLPTGELVAHFKDLTQRSDARETARPLSLGNTPPTQTAA